MTEWGVVGVIITGIGFVGAVLAITDRISKPLKELNVSVAVLNANMTRLSEEMKLLTTRNSETHERLFKRLDNTKDRIEDHETRIKLLEHDDEVK